MTEACWLEYDTDRALIFRHIEVHYPRFDKKKLKWTCDCDEFALDGWMHDCKHIREAKKKL